jgi:hypothetical protein
LYYVNPTLLYGEITEETSSTLADKQLLSQPNTPPPPLLSSFNELLLIGRAENLRPADLDPAGFGTFGCSDPDPKYLKDRIWIQNYLRYDPDPL